MRTFSLWRDTDVSGVSGTGLVAEGAVFSTGWVALQWLGAVQSIVFYQDIADVAAIHGHDGKTRVVFDAQ